MALRPLLLTPTPNHKVSIGQHPPQVTAIHTELLSDELEPNATRIDLAGRTDLCSIQGPTLPATLRHTTLPQMPINRRPVHPELLSQLTNLSTLQSSSHQLVNHLIAEATETTLWQSWRRRFCFRIRRRCRIMKIVPLWVV
jgi:hypothetical protein